MSTLTGTYKTLTVRRSWPAATAAGATALVLDTVEEGPIAFYLPPEAIPAVRKALADAEALLARGPGKA